MGGFPIFEPAQRRIAALHAPRAAGAVAEHAAPSVHPASRIARGAQTTPNAEQLAMSSAGQAEAGQPLRLPRGG